MLHEKKTGDRNQYYTMDPDNDGKSNHTSDEDDKTSNVWWAHASDFKTLPENVQMAILNSKKRAKHSEFYYKLRGLQDRIHLFKGMFYAKQPKYVE